MKKVLLGIMASTILVGSSFAQTSNTTFNGVYAGGGVTYSNGKIKNKVDTAAAFNKMGPNNFSGSVGGSTSGVGFNAFLGYGTLYAGSFYLGGELGLGYDGSRFKNKSAGSGNFNGFTFKSSSALTYSFVGRLGYAISQALPYIKFGFEGRSAATLRNAKGNSIPLEKGGSVKARRNGLILGFGLDYAVNKNIFLRAEYTHNFGAKSSYSFNNVKILDFRTTTDTFLIGAGYKF